MASPTKEAVNHPAHYNSHPSGIEAIDLIEDLPFNIGNAIKYLYRCHHKADDPREDLRKGLWYVRREIERRKKRTSPWDSVNSASLTPLYVLFERVLRAEERPNIERALRALFDAAVFETVTEPLDKAVQNIEWEIESTDAWWGLGDPNRDPAPTSTAPPAREDEPVADPEVVALASLLKAERFHCKVCKKAGSVSRTPNGPFSVTCTTCGVNISADERGLAFERWTTMIAKQNPKPVSERVADAQLREDTSTPQRDSH